MALGTLSSSWDNKLSLNLALWAESQADLAAALETFKNEVGNALRVRHEFGWALELMATGLEVHT